jgi:hypothetical protein
MPELAPVTMAVFMGVRMPQAAVWCKTFGIEGFGAAGHASDHRDKVSEKVICGDGSK